MQARISGITWAMVLGVVILATAVPAQVASSTWMATTASLEKENKSAIALTPLVMEGPVDSAYLLGPGDVLEVLVEKSNFPVQISPEGSIALEEVGLITVGGLPLYTARDTIMERLAKRYPRQWCHVHLIQLRQVSVLITGAVGIPGNHVNRGQVRLSLVLRQAGGVSHAGNDQGIILVRSGDTLRVNHAVFENQGDLSQDPFLEGGDHVHVPFIDNRSDGIQITLGAHTQSALWQEGKKLVDYLYNTGLIRNANGLRYARIQGKDGSGRMLELREALNTVLMPGDWVELGTETKQVYVGGSTSRNGAFEFVPGHKAKDYISMAGLNILSGDIEDVVVVRPHVGYITVNAYTDDILPGDVLLLPKNRFEATKEFVGFLGSVMGIIATSLSLYLLIQQQQ